LKEELNILKRQCEYDDVKKLNLEIKSIQDRLGFSAMSATEEKKLIERMNKLLPLREKTKRLSDLKEKIKIVRPQIGETKKLREEINKIFDKINSIKEEIIKNKEKKNDNFAEINNLKSQRTNLTEENGKLRQKIKEIRYEWNDKWYQYEKQQKEIDYINQIIKKKKLLQKQAEKAKKKGIEDGKVEAKLVTKTENKHYYEIELCDNLKAYFENIINPNKAIQETEKKQEKFENKDLKEDLAKGLLKEIIKVEDSQYSMSIGGGKKNKKGKVPSVNKRDQKVTGKSSDLLVLDLGVINQINELNLKAPAFKKDVPEFVRKLETISEGYKSGNKPNLDGNVDGTRTVTKVEIVKEEPKVEIVKEELNFEEKIEPKVEVKEKPKIKLTVSSKKMEKVEEPVIEIKEEKKVAEELVKEPHKDVKVNITTSVEPNITTTTKTTITSDSGKVEQKTDASRKLSNEGEEEVNLLFNKV
jgi:hypothetical protein